MNLVVSLVAIILGAFITAFPAQAARIWGSDKLEKSAPARKTVFVWWWQVFGILLCLGGILSVVDSFGLSTYHH
jgi:hypothetical protein